ncbi:hypothetical protein ABTM91_20900, partial [Acinetobacter baumannii]
QRDLDLARTAGEVQAVTADTAVMVSESVPTPAGIDYWLRFKSPGAIGDTVTARVHEPRGVRNPPTIIYGHGVCVDFDHW